MKFKWKWVPFIGVVVSYIQREKLWSYYPWSWNGGARGWRDKVEEVKQADLDCLHACAVTVFTGFTLLIGYYLLKM